MLACSWGLFKIVDNDLIPFRLEVAKRIAATRRSAAPGAAGDPGDPDAKYEPCPSGQRGRSRDVGVAAAISGGPSRSDSSRNGTMHAIVRGRISPGVYWVRPMVTVRRTWIARRRSTDGWRVFWRAGRAHRAGCRSRSRTHRRRRMRMPRRCVDRLRQHRWQ